MLTPGLKSAGEDPYSAEVRRYFVSPVHVGELQSAYTLVVSADVGDGGGNRLQLSAGVDGEKLQELRFRALGCPHLIAAAEHFCKQYSGKAIETLANFRPEQTIEDLAVPAWKSGRILLLEDAVRQLWRKATENGTEQPDAQSVT